MTAPRRTLVLGVVGYAAMIGGAVAIVLAIRAHGLTLTAPAPVPAAPRFGEGASAAGGGTVLHILLALVAILAVAHLVGAGFKRLGQPAVVGEMFAGIALGPSLLGRVAPGLSALVFPPSVMPFVSTLAQFGVVLYMFLVGLELDTRLISKRTHVTLAISHASIVLPFVLGCALALPLYPILSTSDVPFTAFTLFFGISLSVTAFPVLARILTERDLQYTPLGAVALTCAAVDDVTAWCLLALVMGVVRARPGEALQTVLLTVGYIALMFGAVRPLLARVVGWADLRDARTGGGRGRTTLIVACVALLASSLATEAIGIHAIFGAFLLGTMVPHDSNVTHKVIAQLEPVVVVLLLPVFFAFTGLRTEIGLLSGATSWGICASIIGVASLGKFGGSAIAARLCGLGWRDSSAIGVLMNTRGLMELVVLNIGLDLHVLSPLAFAMLVTMAVLTTLATTPALQLAGRAKPAEGDSADVLAARQKA